MSKIPNQMFACSLGRTLREWAPACLPPTPITTDTHAFQKQISSLCDALQRTNESKQELLRRPWATSCSTLKGVRGGGSPGAHVLTPRTPNSLQTSRYCNEEGNRILTCGQKVQAKSSHEPEILSRRPDLLHETEIAHSEAFNFPRRDWWTSPAIEQGRRRDCTRARTSRPYSPSERMHCIIDDLDVAASGIHKLQDTGASGPFGVPKARRLWLKDAENVSPTGFEEGHDTGMTAGQDPNRRYEPAHPEGIVWDTDSHEHQRRKESAAGRLLCNDSKRQAASK